MSEKSFHLRRIEDFYNKYKYNSELIKRLERNIVLESYSFEKWYNLFISQSASIRTLFSENEEMLNFFIRSYLDSQVLMPSEKIDTYLLHIMFFLFENNVDSLVSKDLNDYFLFFKKKLTPTQLFHTLYTKFIYMAMSGRTTKQESETIYKELINIIPSVDSVQESFYPAEFMFVYYFRVLQLSLSSDFELVSLKNSVDEFERILNSIQNEQTFVFMWGANPDVDFHKKQLIRIIKIFSFLGAGLNSFLDKNHNILDPSNSVVETFGEWLRLEFENEREEKQTNCMVTAYYYKFLYLTKKITKEEYAKFLTSEYSELCKTGILDFSFPESFVPADEGNDRNPIVTILDGMKLFCNSFSFVFVFLQELISVVDDKKLIYLAIQNMELFFANLPYSDKGFLIDKFIVSNLKVVLPNFTTHTDIQSYLQIVFVHRQVSTAIHFAMVSRLAVICANHILEKKPELFSSIPMFLSDGELDKRKVLQFVSDSGFYHDLGKLACTDIINLHFRKITDKEFSVIMEHPNIGKEIADDVPLLKEFKDIIVGHHKSWNGKKGYPKEFDNTKSPYKIIIDLITICDCIDAATDILGRNYAIGKSFVEVLKEFEKEAGSRYSPEIVDLFLSSEKLRNEITYLTSEGRSSVYYEIYNQYVAPHVVFSYEQERSVVSYSPKYFESTLLCLKNCYAKKNLGNNLEKFLNSFFLCENFYGLLLVDLRGTVYGMLFGRKTYDLDGRVFFLDFIAVDPKFQRHGYGSTLIRHLEENLKNEGIEKTILDVPQNFNSESFFWINGFVDTTVKQMINNSTQLPNIGKNKNISKP